jgi:transposase
LDQAVKQGTFISRDFIADKNWLFMGSPAGAKAGAIFYSLIETCKTNKIEPYKYLCAMLNRVRECVTEDDYRKLRPQFIKI